MADFPPHWVPLSQGYYVEDPHHQNISPNLGPSPEQQLLGHGSAGMFRGFYSGGVQRPHTGPLPAYQHGIQNSVQRQVETLMDTRAMFLLRQQNRVMRNRMPEIQTVSEHKGRIRSASNNHNAKNIGTGVFLPVLRPTAPATETRQGEKGNQKNESREADEENKEESSYELPPDICLPSEWTY